MSKGSNHQSLEGLQRRLQELENHLFIAHQTIFELVPEPASGWLSASMRVRTEDDLSGWHNWLVENVLLLAVRKPGAARGSDGRDWRAVCPLCGDGASRPYVTGFSHPVGLRRHLTGTGGAAMCPIVRAAHFDASDWVESERTGPRLQMEGPGFDSTKPWEQPAHPLPAGEVIALPRKPR